MKPTRLESYLDELRGELRARGLLKSRTIEEVGGHLADAVERLQREGRTPELAEREALERFGSAQELAGQFSAETHRFSHRMLLGVAVAAGLGIAYLDARSTWDQTGITAAAALFVASAVLGRLGPRRRWLLALGVGIWVPLLGIAKARDYTMLVLLLFPFAGACAGSVCRSILTASWRDWRELWVGPVALLVAAATGGAFLFLPHHESEKASPQLAEATFERLRARFGDERPLLDMRARRPASDPGGSRTRAALHSLHTVIFDTRGGERIVRITVPYRFARLFARHRGGFRWLGELTSLDDTEFDPEPIQLGLDEVERHGPGLIVDYRHASGGQFIAWAE
jgi:hypothetical protein